jgi:hypothetical protein
MAQGLLQLPTTGTVSGLQNSQDANAAFAALAGMVQGGSAPTPASTGLASTAGVWWHDTTNNQIKVRDQADANWILIAAVDETNKLWVPVFNGQVLGVALAGSQPIVNAGGTGWLMAGPHYGLKNKFHNGGCEVAQRNAPSLSTTFQYGAVDRFLAAVTAGTVSAGTIAQNTAASVGRTGKSLHCSGVTTTGLAVVSAKQRVESVDAVKFKNQNGSVSLRVYQDTGGAINYQITIRKPTAADNYASTTQIAQSGLISVPNATDTLIAFANQALGDCSNGLEVQVDAQCGAVTIKNFHFTEWQIEEGPVATPFERRPYTQELRDCRRFVRPAQIQFQTFCAGTQVLGMSTTFEEMRTTPAITNSSTSGSSNISPSFSALDARTIFLSGATPGAGTTTLQGTATLTADL